MSVLDPFINPGTIGISYFYERLLQFRKFNIVTIFQLGDEDDEDKVFFSLNNLPKISFINLDGFDFFLN